MMRSSRLRNLIRCAYLPALRLSTNSAKASPAGRAAPSHGRHNKKHGYTRHGLSVHRDKRSEKLHERAKRPPKRQYPQVLYRACHVRRKLHRRPHYGKVHKFPDPAYILVWSNVGKEDFDVPQPEPEQLRTQYRNPVHKKTRARTRYARYCPSSAKTQRPVSSTAAPAAATPAATKCYRGSTAAPPTTACACRLSWIRPAASSTKDTQQYA